MIPATEPSATQLLANAASRIVEMHGGNVHDFQDLRGAAFAALREAGIKPTDRIKAAKELKLVADAMSGLHMLYPLCEASDDDDGAGERALMEVGEAHAALARRAEFLTLAVCAPLKRPPS